MMNSRIPIMATMLLGSALFAQEAAENEDPIEAAIRAFNNRDKSKPNEVIVVLDPPTPAPSEKPTAEAPANATDTPKEPATDTPKEPASDPGKPVLVTGKPPEGSKLIDISEIPIVPDDTAPEPDPHKGLEVRVESVQSGNGRIDTSKVNLLAPFPAKPLGQPPAGWHLESSDEAPAFQHEVELSPGKKITLTIRPHLLVPNADGNSHFAVAEPGFNASLGYSQRDTVGAAVSQSIEQLEQDSKQLGSAIDLLQQLLVTLPADPQPADKDAKAKQPKAP